MSKSSCRVLWRRRWWPELGVRVVEVALRNSASPSGAEGGLGLGRFGAECARTALLLGAHLNLGWSALSLLCSSLKRVTSMVILWYILSQKGGSPFQRVCAQCRRCSEEGCGFVGVAVGVCVSSCGWVFANSASPSGAEGGLGLGRFGGVQQCLSLPAGCSGEDVGGQSWASPCGSRFAK